jgi:cyclophilin family peptidyl-prolyl cis-trans isomerase
MVAALALLGLTAACAGAAFAAGPDSASKATSPPAAGATKAAASTETPAAKPAVAAGAAHAAATGATMKPKTGPEVVVLETVLGDIVIRLKEADAPKTTANFKKLVSEKYYDGTYFHRVIPGFMIQGGDPNSKNADAADDGLGGPGYTVPAEIKLPHLRGSVATARQGDQVNPAKESSGSQFFIDVAPQPSLDRGGYTVFGEVIQGMDAVDKIVALAREPGVVAAAGGGANPQKKALIKRAYLAPASQYSKGAGADTTKKEAHHAPAAAPAKTDTSKGAGG